MTQILSKIQLSVKSKSLLSGMSKLLEDFLKYHQ
jgi:hypothetical protein